ncbi:PAS domain-containing protein [Halobacteriales archaeon Cl-PHB]
MQQRVPRAGVGRFVGALAAVAVVAVVAAGGAASGVTAAGLAVLLAGPAGRDGVLGHVGWIAAGAVALGAVGFVTGTVVEGFLTPVLAAGMGIAVGGGLGAVVRLLAVGETEPTTPETMTVGNDGADRTTSQPEPRPADLFEHAPDPILYYGDAGDGPVVRAVNPAFESTFGVSANAVTDAALSDAAMVTERAADLDAAARDGGGFDAVVDCETPDGTRQMRIRVAADAAGGTTDGYVLYTPSG